MAQAKRETVLVTGGSGFLAGWCIIELLKQGYTVRTTVRDVAKREQQVRETVRKEVDPGDRLTVVAADLLSDEGWPTAVAGCDYVLHVASPFPPQQPDDPDELIKPAREGTLRVLKAGLDAGAKRVVVTSSVAAIRGSAKRDRPMDENDWNDPDDESLTPYVRSKTIAERAAWDFVRERGEEDKLAVVNPGAIIGPVLNDDLSYSLQSIQRLLKGAPGVPRLGFAFVNVRDVAALEILAMTQPEAGGKRFIAATEFMWMADAGSVLHERLGDRARKVPTRTIPNVVVRAMSLVDRDIRSVTGMLGKMTEYSSERAKQLGWQPHDVRDTIADTAESLIAVGAAPGTS